ncbi:hypothetical protein COCON_G00059890 [Conger conger]|uniref:IGFBP N-terminal domain-containing protein n=1 Tax=Conger conger TaxID=82655 RepID=A0A9Q1DR35_CONCO|nr:hypothetical protein COCON_G00059890 [Conger conger]
MQQPGAAMRTALALLWLWFWLCCYAEQEQTRKGLGQECGWAELGRCDTNLTCVPETLTDPGESPGPSVCKPVPQSSGCVPCAEVQCPKAKRQCPGSHVTEPCGCCQHCARQRGQVCGGPHWERGYCDRGLTCTRFLGHVPATPPETGVCKALPGYRVDHWADPHCPWQWGCNIRAGSCDCYGTQTCQLAFAYHSMRDCMKTMEEDWRYAGMTEEELEAEQWECMTNGCEIQGDKCVCMKKSCFSKPPLLSEDDCENQLEQTRCANVSCPIVPVPSCPPDSFLTAPYTPLHQCCPLLPALCTCAFERCPAEPTDCPPGHRAHIVTRGDGHPGTCCHRYLCRRGEEESATQKREEEED